MSKRPHERGPSLSLRPHKSLRSLRENANNNVHEDEVMSMDSVNHPRPSSAPKQPKPLWDRLQMISTSEPLIVPPLNFLGRLTRPLTNFDISGVTAWPSSLGAIKRQFRYNLTPQYGRSLSTQVINLTAWRRMTPAESPEPAVKAPYLHLGFATWLNMDVFVALPHLPLEACVEQDLGRIQDNVLEAWTDRIFLPAMYDGDATAPSSWRMARDNRFSTMWYDDAVADFPTYQIFTGDALAGIWAKVQHVSQSIHEFRDPFLIMHMEKRHSGVFTGHNPEVVFRDFEQAWMQEVDTRYIGLDQDNLKISISCDLVV